MDDKVFTTAFSSLSIETRELFFPEGFSDAKRVITELAEACDLNLNDITESTCRDMLDIYSGLVILFSSKNYNDKNACSYLANNYQYYLKNKVISDSIIKKAKSIFADSSEKLDTDYIEKTYSSYVSQESLDSVKEDNDSIGWFYLFEKVLFVIHILFYLFMFLHALGNAEEGMSIGTFTYIISVAFSSTILYFLIKREWDVFNLRIFFVFLPYIVSAIGVLLSGYTSSPTTFIEQVSELTRISTEPIVAIIAILGANIEECFVEIPTGFITIAAVLVGLILYAFFAGIYYSNRKELFHPFCDEDFNSEEIVLNDEEVMNNDEEELIPQETTTVQETDDNEYLEETEDNFLEVVEKVPKPILLSNTVMEDADEDVSDKPAQSKNVIVESREIETNKSYTRLFCRICGHEIPNDSVFCPHCGEKVQIIHK